MHEISRPSWTLTGSGRALFCVHGQTQQQIADKLNVHVNTVATDISTHKIVGSETVTNSRGQERPATYRKPRPRARGLDDNV